MGRPKKLKSVCETVVRIAKETGWGYGWILGELKKLRIHAVSQSAITNILKQAGMLPRPKRGQDTWGECLKIYAETLALLFALYDVALFGDHGTSQSGMSAKRRFD